MFQFILTDVLMIALGTIVYVLVRALPRVHEPEHVETQSLFERWITSDIPEKFDLFFNNLLHKVLRKLKVFLLKVDNNVTKHLAKVKSDLKEEQKPNFKEITGGEVAKEE